MATTPQNIPQEEQAPDEIQQLADALLFLFRPVAHVTSGLNHTSTNTIHERFNETFPDMYTPSQMVVALKRAGFRMYNAGEMDIRWLLAEKL